MAAESACRTAEDLLSSGLAVINQAIAAGAQAIFPLFSGGHDSLCACYVSSYHPAFANEVHHIDTGIGSRATRRFVEQTCDDLQWELRVYRSPFTYERFVRRLGFPGPGAHQWVYTVLKDRCVGSMIKGRGPVALITGCRQQESRRRMGSLQPVAIGETSKRSGKTTKTNRIWTSPCFDWSSEEQILFLNAMALPRNPIKQSLLGMSGECFCGAFARPGEMDMLRAIVPDVANEIDRLSQIAKDCGKHCRWGTRPAKEKGFVTAKTGPLCSSCDVKMAARGVLLESIGSE